jgi:hypothetical protein
MEMRSSRPRFTYATVVSTLCLCLLVGGGTAFAATQILPKNSVGAKQLRKGAVTPAKLSKSAKTTMTGSQGPQGLQGIQGSKGERGEPGAPATKLFAQVQEDGTVNASGSPVTVHRSFPGQYLVNFGQDITHCAAFANQGGVPVFSFPGASTPAANGYGARITINSPDPGLEIAPGFPVANTVSVETFSGSSPTSTSFYVAVFC